MKRDTTGEGSVPNQEVGGSPIFWGDNKGPVVMVWDGMLPGEQESAKKTISEENDWIIWRAKPSRGAFGERGGADRQSQETTDFLEQHGTRLDGIKPRGVRLKGFQRMSPEEGSLGGKDGTAPTISERWHALGTWRFGSLNRERASLRGV